ncbi:hypothetical protein CgunFtcFv8_023822 [Champsocephalus gunnari]|uniref:Uncharacterized protein n=1 Tax=Champsocephalus gunnari TaxID=52237 RepID=A0AAN8DAM3_CHAGU|nr:hypothetical protein CgunFtcFv8_023822 [Champsocephalus gunnari]
MAAGRYFPSIHDERADNKNIWTYLDLKTEQLNSRPISFTNACFNKGCKDGKTHSTALQDDAKADWRGSLAVADYRPLDVFSSSAVDPGSTSWSEDDDMCEINIRLKEIELRDVVEEPLCIPETTHQRIVGCRTAETKSKKPVGKTRTHF